MEFRSYTQAHDQHGSEIYTDTTIWYFDHILLNFQNKGLNFLKYVKEISMFPQFVRKFGYHINFHPPAQCALENIFMQIDDQYFDLHELMIWS